MKRRLFFAECCAVGFALVVAVAALLHQLRYPSALFDAGQYADMGRAIAARGLFSRFMESEVRTYGYPLVLSLVFRVADHSGLPWTVVLFAVQLGAYMAAVFALRRSMMAWSVVVARSAFIGLLLNYYALIYTPECLTESLSLTSLVLLAAGWFAVRRRKGPLWLVAILTLLAGFAVLIRPANAFVAAAWIVGAVLTGARSGLSVRRLVAAAALVAVCFTLPFLPQLTYNVRHFGRWTPLLARDLGARQQAWGVQYIKYATAMPPIPESAVPYLNPWLPGTAFDAESPLAWYVAYPGRAALTVALHGFNATDQDLLFTYSRDLDPWYRRPLGVVNHAVVAMGALGLLLGLIRVARADSRDDRAALALLLVLVGGWWAVHALVAVEMRFGLALLSVLFPAAAYAMASAVQSGRFGLIALAAGAVACYVAGALCLSSWVRDQSPVIRVLAAVNEQSTADADGDGVADGMDRCRTQHAETPDGCPRPAPASGVSGHGAPAIVLVNRDTGQASAVAPDAGSPTAGTFLSELVDPGWRIVGTSDFTDDGEPDLLWQKEASGAIRLFPMHGGVRGDQIPIGPPVGDARWRVACTGDFNGDGHADIVWQHQSAGYVVIWFLTVQDGRPVMQSATYVTRDGDAVASSGEPQVVGSMDFDGDGYRDLLVQANDTGNISVWKLGARRRLGVPVLETQPLGSAGPSFRLRAVGDFAGDDRGDLFFQSMTTAQLLLWERADSGFRHHDVSTVVPPRWELSGPK